MTVTEAHAAVIAVHARYEMLRNDFKRYTASGDTSIANALGREIRWARIEIEIAEDDLEAACDAAGVERI